MADMLVPFKHPPSFGLSEARTQSLEPFSFPTHKELNPLITAKKKNKKELKKCDLSWTLDFPKNQLFQTIPIAHNSPKK
jgi:hypothetical protein